MYIPPSQLEEAEPFDLTALQDLIGMSSHVIRALVNEWADPEAEPLGHLGELWEEYSDIELVGRWTGRKTYREAGR